MHTNVFFDHTTYRGEVEFLQLEPGTGHSRSVGTFIRAKSGGLEHTLNVYVYSFIILVPELGNQISLASCMSLLCLSTTARDLMTSVTLNVIKTIAILNIMLLGF